MKIFSQDEGIPKYTSINSLGLDANCDSYGCTNCPGLVEILAINDLDNTTTFRCLNPNDNKSIKTVPISEYLNSMKNHIYLFSECSLCSKKQNETNTPVFSYCIKCNVVICSDCLDKHLKSNEKNHHEFNNEYIIKNNEKNIRCFSHPEEKNLAFCFDCNTHICEKCMKNKRHITHRKNNILEVSVTHEIKKMLNSIIDIYDGKVKENKIRKNELINQTEENKKTIEKNKMDKEKEIKMNLNKEKRKLLKKLKADLSKLELNYKNEIKLRKNKYKILEDFINQKHEILNNYYINKFNDRLEKIEKEYQDSIYTLECETNHFDQLLLINRIIKNTQEKYSDNYYHNNNINNIILKYYESKDENIQKILTDDIYNELAYKEKEEKKYINKKEKIEKFGNLEKFIFNDNFYSFLGNQEEIFIICDFDSMLQITGNNKKTLKLNKNSKSILVPQIIKNFNYDDIAGTIDLIIQLSEENNKLFVFFIQDFWKSLLNYINAPTIDNIKKCSELNIKFKKYYSLVCKLYQCDNIKKKIEDENKNKSVKHIILDDAEQFYQKDEYGSAIHKMVTQFIKENENLEVEEILNCVMEYDTYYTEEKYIDKRNLNIFDKINFNEIRDDFFDKFRNYKFEEVFKKNIYGYLSNLTSKILTISHFDILIKLINVENIKNVEIFLNLLDNKYKNIVKDSLISSLSEEGKTAAISTIARIADLFYIKQKDVKFLSEQIEKLDEKLIPLVYIELIKKCNDDEHEKMIKFIFNRFLSNIKDEDINNIVVLIESLKEKNKIQFYCQLSENYAINEEDFYSSKSNIKVKLLCVLKEKDDQIKDNNEKDDEIQNNNDNSEDKKLIKEGNEYYYKCIFVLEKINDDLEKKKTLKKYLDSLLNNDKDIVIRRLNLLKLVENNTFILEDKYNELMNERDKINKKIEDLYYIKDELSLYHKEVYTKEVIQIGEITKQLENGRISEFYEEKMSEEINGLLKLKTIADKVSKVKDFMLFQCIFDETKENSPTEKFNATLKILDNIEYSIKSEESDELSLENSLSKYKEKLFTDDEKQMDELLKQFQSYFNLEKDEEKLENINKIADINTSQNKKEIILDELKILIYSKIYEKDINSIFYFFENCGKTNESWDKKLPVKYKNISSKSLKELKESLIEIKNTEIYDYTNKGNYVKFFNYLYDKKEAIDFLKEKNTNEIQLLIEKLDLNDSKISKKDLDDTYNCVGFFAQIKKLNDNFEIFEFIKKNIDGKILKEFENFSNIYLSIIEFV